jgi:hypothetical protein
MPGSQQQQGANNCRDVKTKGRQQQKGSEEHWNTSSRRELNRADIHKGIPGCNSETEFHIGMGGNWLLCLFMAQTQLQLISPFLR